MRMRRHELLWRRPLRVTQMHTYRSTQRRTKIDIIRQNTNFLQCGCTFERFSSDQENENEREKFMAV